MYRGFNLAFDASQFTKRYSQYEEVGKTLFQQQKKQVFRSLQDVVLHDGSLNGEQLQNQWFPQVEADLFISHSHQDEDAAICLVGYLQQELGIVAFVDSVVWSHSDGLLKKIDDKYCRYEENGRYYYRYATRNRSTSHVHLMLSGALTKMIDTAECVFFLNTPHSVQPEQVLGTESTLSPWLYAEILTTRFIRKRPPHQHRRHFQKSFSQGGEVGRIDESVKITLPIEMGHLTAINAEAGFLERWKQKVAANRFALDSLYRMYPGQSAPLTS